MSAPAQETDNGIPREGDVLAGKYRVERVLGQGGMGVVVAAEHTALRKTVAVKLLLPDAMERSDSVERFLREGRSAMSIQSEHIARVHDFGTLESGQPFMVMEYLTGEDLDVALKKRGPMPITEAVDYVLQACEAIAEAHSLGIIHRDLKPANLFITKRADGSAFVKVLDFGLSKPTKIDALEPSLTSANTVMGSPYYMSPEQVRSLKNIDARADVWALGVILYQLTSGHRPFEEESLGALFVMIGAEPPTPIRKWVPDVPEVFEAILLKCLEKAPANRFQTVAELARALAPFSSEGARVSIERILRLLADHAPLPRTPLESMPEIARTSTPSQAPAPVDAAARTVSATTGDASAKPPSQESMPGMSSSLVASPVLEQASSTGRQQRGNRSRAGVYVAATALALVAGAVTVLLMMRPPSGSPPPSAAAGEGRPTATQVVATAAPPAPSVVPAPATATAAEVTSASAAPSASEAPTATTTAPASSSGAKKPWPTKTKKADPLDRR